MRCQVRRLGNCRVARQIGRRAYYDPADVGSDARRNQRGVRQLSDPHGYVHTLLDQIHGTVVKRHAPIGWSLAVRFACEWRDDSGNWFRSYGNENWEFDENGLMRVRIASINDLPIEESERKYHWPLGRRPDDHPSLSDLGL